MRSPRGSRRHNATQAAVAAAVLTVAGTVAVLLRRIRPPAGLARPGGSAPSPSAFETPPPETARDTELRCECGKAYRVGGAGRHRVIWPEGSDEREDLLEDACVECGRPLAPEDAASA